MVKTNKKKINTVTAAKRQAKVTESVKHMQQRSVHHASARALEELNELLKERPLVTQHLLSLMDMGAFDSVDKPENDADRLPASCNKFSLLAKSVVIALVVHLCPGLQEWLNGFSKKSSKTPILQLLCFLVHVAQDSALPSKHKSVLTEWCADRFRKQGRGGMQSLSLPKESEDVKQWIERLGEEETPVGYWALTCETDTVTLMYVPTGQTCNLPQKLMALADDLDLENVPLG